MELRQLGGPDRVEAVEQMPLITIEASESYCFLGALLLGQMRKEGNAHVGTTSGRWGHFIFNR